MSEGYATEALRKRHLWLLVTAGSGECAQSQQERHILQRIIVGGRKFETVGQDRHTEKIASLGKRWGKAVSGGPSAYGRIARARAEFPVPLAAGTGP
jgi:hypothetical protein